MSRLKKKKEAVLLTAGGALVFRMFEELP